MSSPSNKSPKNYYGLLPNDIRNFLYRYKRKQIEFEDFYKLRDKDIIKGLKITLKNNVYDLILLRLIVLQKQTNIDEKLEKEIIEKLEKELKKKESVIDKETIKRCIDKRVIIEKDIINKWKDKINEDKSIISIFS